MLSSRSIVHIFKMTLALNSCYVCRFCYTSPLFGRVSTCSEILFLEACGTVHYHIRWAHIPLLDWESFMTRVEAEAAAQVLARRGETYSIEEVDEGCQRGPLGGSR